MKNNFSKYGYGFQIKLLSAILTDKIYYQQINDILLPKYFESEANKNLLECIKLHYDKYNVAPTKDVFKIHVQKIENEVLKANVIQHLKDVFDSVGSPDLAYIKDESLTFCRNQEWRSAIEDSIPLLEEDKFDEIKERFSKADKAGTEKFTYYDYKSEVDARYQEEDRNTIATGWDVINDICGNGLGSGELGILVAGPGGGKSWSLVNIAGTAVKNGKTVFYYTLELYENYTGKRFDAFQTGIAFQNLKYHIDEVKSCISKLPGNLVIEYAPAGTLSISQIQAHVDKSIINGIVPDMIIVDYADLLKGTGRYRNTDKRHEIGNIYIDLRGIAGKYKIPIWTASQANREGADAEIITGTQVAEDFSKVMTGDLVISLARKLKNKLGGTGTWHIIKNRFGPDGLSFPSKINTSNGSIQIFDENTQQGKNTKIDIQNGDDLIRKSLASKYKQMNNAGESNKLTKFN